jgi:hypothetical protein
MRGVRQGVIVLLELIVHDVKKKIQLNITGFASQ